MPKITLKNGIVLDDEYGMAPTLARYAKDKGLDDARVFLSDDGKIKRYLLILGTDPIYEGQTAEAIAIRIDLIAFTERDVE